MRTATRMCTSTLIFMARWHLFISLRRDKQTARETIICRLTAGNFEDETDSRQNMLYRMTGAKFEYEQTRQTRRFVEWKPRMLRTKETQHENAPEWRGQKEGQNKINISKTMQDFYARLPRPANPGGGGVLGSIFAGYVPLASPNPYPIIVYSVANYRPQVSHFWANIPDTSTCWNLRTPEIPQVCDPILVTLLAPIENATPL